MNKPVIAMSCAVLGLATSLAPIKARAQSDSDKQFLTLAAQSDQNEIALSQLAEQKATDPAVKKYAMKMVTDHNKLTDSMKPYAMKWGLTPPSGPDSDHQQEISKLNGLSGKEFDKAYMDDMVADHQKALDAFSSEVSSTQDARFKRSVEKGKAVVASHTTMAKDLDTKV